MTLNIEFHLFFPRKTGSEELLQAISQLRKRVFRFAYSQVTTDHRTEQYLKDHQDLIDALKGKTKEKPEKIMVRHVEYTRNSFLNFYRKFDQMGLGTRVSNPSLGSSFKVIQALERTAILDATSNYKARDPKEK